MAKKTKKTTPHKAKAAKPARRGGGISAREVGPIRRKLLDLRDDLLRKVKDKAEFEPTAETGDEADQASQSLEKEIAFELSDNERQMLDQTEAALRKIENGTYGVCESCRQAIPKPRIKALPFARYCVACQSRAETSPVS